MRAADTNVLVRLIIRDDDAQVAAAEQFTAQGVWVSSLVFAECMWVFTRVYGRPANEVAAAVEVLLSKENLFLEDPEAVADALQLFRERPALGFSDCLILALARQAGHLPLGTFDRDLGKVAGTQKL